MDLSIIVVNWNTRDLLAQCLSSVFSSQSTSGEQDQTATGDNVGLQAGDRPRSTEVFVVDNASSDGSAEMVRKRFPQVRLIENRENMGFARANNQAIRESSGRFVLLLNSDTIVQPGALSWMVAFMETHGEAGIVGGNILNADGTRQYCFARFPTLLSEIALALGLDTHFPFSTWFGPRLDIDDESISADWVGGAALMVRRQALDRAGLLDESYFMYSEEVDLAYRIRCAGWKTCVLRDARIIHLGQQSSRRAPAAMKVQLFRSKVLYFTKHHGSGEAAVLDFVFAVSIIVKCFLYRLQRRDDLAGLWLETWKHFVEGKQALPGPQELAAQ